MKQSEVLKELVRQVRGDTLQGLAATRDDWLTWGPPGTSNHILWHAGHAVWLQDLMCIELLSGQSELPEGWAKTFGANSEPATTREWPSRGKVRSRLQSQLDRLLELLDAASDEVLSEAPTKFRHMRTNLGWIIHGLHDEDWGPMCYPPLNSLPSPPQQAGFRPGRPC